MRLLHAILFVAMVLYGCASTHANASGDAQGGDGAAVDATGDGDRVEVSPGDAPDGDAPMDVVLVPPLTPQSPGRRLVLMQGRTMVLNAEGTWYGWGDELGQSFGEVPPLPTRQITPLPLDERRYVHIISLQNTCRIPRTGRRAPQCWGGNDNGQLAIGQATGPARTPLDVIAFEGAEYFDAQMSIAWTSEATFMWPTRVAGPSVMYDYLPRRVRDRPFCAINRNLVYDCESRDFEHTTTSINGIRGFLPVQHLEGVIAYSTHDSDLAVLRDGTLLCRGNCPAMAGDTSPLVNDTFRRVAGLSPLRYASTANSWSDACAITQQNSVVCWGDCATALYIGPVCESWTRETRYLRPTPIPGLEDVVELATGDRHACAITRRRELWCWGNNRAHAVVPTSELPVFYTPVRIDIPNL